MAPAGVAVGGLVPTVGTNLYRLAVQPLGMSSPQSHAQTEQFPAIRAEWSRLAPAGCWYPTEGRGGHGLRDANQRQRRSSKDPQSVGGRVATDRHAGRLPRRVVVSHQPRAPRLRPCQGLRPRTKPDELVAGAVPWRADHRSRADYL